MKDLLNFYEALVRYAGWKTDPDGYVLDKISGANIMIAESNGKPKKLVLPHKQHLVMSDELIVFHPLRENINKGESSVMYALRRAINAKLNVAVATILISFIRLAVTPQLQSSLNGDQTDVLKLMADISDKTFRAFPTAVSLNTEAFRTNMFVHVHTKRGRTHEGIKRHWCGYVDFPEPFSDPSTKQPKPPLPKLKDKDKESISKLIEYIFPDCKVPGKYTFVASSEPGTILETTLLASFTLSTRINDVIDLYPELFEELSEMFQPFDHDVTDYIGDHSDVGFSELQVMARKLPMQRGNEGSLASDDQKPATIQEPVPVVAQQRQSTQQGSSGPRRLSEIAPRQPVVQEQPQQVVSRGPMRRSEMVGNQQQPSRQYNQAQYPVYEPRAQVSAQYGGHGVQPARGGHSQAPLLEEMLPNGNVRFHRNGVYCYSDGREVPGFEEVPEYTIR